MVEERNSVFILAVGNTTTTEPLLNYEYWGVVVGILSVILGAVAIYITIRIFRKTQNIEKEQTKNAEGLYVVKTQEYLKKIQDHFDHIFKIVENHNINEEEDKQLTTQELNLYFRKYHGEMVKLLQNSERSLELWVNLDRVVRNQFDKVILDFDWLVTKFFPLAVTDDEIRTSIWTTEYEAFLQKKYNIDNVLEKELKADN